MYDKWVANDDMVGDWPAGTSPLFVEDILTSHNVLNDIYIRANNIYIYTYTYTYISNNDITDIVSTKVQVSIYISLYTYI